VSHGLWLSYGEQCKQNHPKRLTLEVGATGANSPCPQQTSGHHLFKERLLLLQRRPLQNHKLELYRNDTYVQLGNEKTIDCGEAMGPHLIFLSSFKGSGAATAE